MEFNEIELNGIELNYETGFYAKLPWHYGIYIIGTLIASCFCALTCA